MGKKQRALTLLSALGFCLVAVCSIFLTVSFIKPPPDDKEEEIVVEEDTEIKEDGKEELKNSYPGNMIQEENDIYGAVASNNKVVFKVRTINKTPCLTRTDISTGKEDIIFTGYDIKNLSIVKNKLFMVMQQTDEDETYQVIAYMDVDSNSVSPINTTKSKEIYSYVSDGENLYYSTTDDNYIYMVDKDYAITKLGESNTKGKNPFIFGIKNGKLYYVNGIEMCTLGITSKQETVISTQYCSIDQKPIMTDNEIICFYNLSHSRLDTIDFNGSFLKTLINEDSQKFPNGIDTVNYSSGHILISANNKIYYLDENNNLQQLKEVSSVSDVFYLTDEYIIYSKEAGDAVTCTKITWLLAS